MTRLVKTTEGKKTRKTKDKVTRSSDDKERQQKIWKWHNAEKIGVSGALNLPRDRAADKDKKLNKQL